MDRYQLDGITMTKTSFFRTLVIPSAGLGVWIFWAFHMLTMQFEIAINDPVSECGSTVACGIAVVLGVRWGLRNPHSKALRLGGVLLHVMMACFILWACWELSHEQDALGRAVGFLVLIAFVVHYAFIWIGAFLVALACICWSLIFGRAIKNCERDQQIGDL